MIPVNPLRMAAPRKPFNWTTVPALNVSSVARDAGGAEPEETCKKQLQNIFLQKCVHTFYTVCI